MLTGLELLAARKIAPCYAEDISFPVPRPRREPLPDLQLVPTPARPVAAHRGFREQEQAPRPLPASLLQDCQRPPLATRHKGSKLLPTPYCPRARRPLRRD